MNSNRTHKPKRKRQIKYEKRDFRDPWKSLYGKPEGTPDESFYRDIQIIKEMSSMGLLSDEKKSAYLEKYSSNYEATLYLTNLFYDTTKETLDNSAAIPDVGTGEPVKLLDIVRYEVKQVLDDCKYEDKSLIVTIRLDGYASPLVRDLDRLDRVLDNYK